MLRRRPRLQLRDVVRLRVSLAALALAGLPAAGCAGSKPIARAGRPAEDPAARFAVRVDADLTRRRFRRAWRTLHPSQRRFMSAADLADCWTRSRTSQLEQQLRFEATGVRDEPWRVAGAASGPQPSKAVRVDVLAAGSRTVLDSFTQHVFELEVGFRWIVSAAIVRQFRSGACGKT